MKGTVLGIRDPSKQLIATAALLPYSERNAWISMVLVTESWRRRGLATRLVDACLEKANKLGIITWLDATPAGATVYGPLGFTPTIELRRLRLANASGSKRATLPAGKLDAFVASDISTIGFDRRELLQELSGRANSKLVSNGHALKVHRLSLTQTLGVVKISDQRNFSGEKTASAAYQEDEKRQSERTDDYGYSDL